jgi:hypothetical protein
LISDRLERIPSVHDVARITAVDRAGNTVYVDLTVDRMAGRRVDRVLMEIKENHELPAEDTR